MFVDKDLFNHFLLCSPLIKRFSDVFRGIKVDIGKKRVKVNNEPSQINSIGVALVFLIVPFEKLFEHREFY